MKFWTCFFVLRVFFFKRAKAKFYAQAQCFEQFLLFQFLKKKSEIFGKNDEKGEARKMTKNDHQGGPRIAKNTKKTTLENLKNQKNGEKKAFLRVPFFHRFFNAFFDEFWVSWASPGGSKNRLFWLFFRLFCAPVASELLLGSPGTVSGRFFIDFPSILARFLVDFFSIFCRFAVGLLRILGRFWIDYFW